MTSRRLFFVALALAAFLRFVGLDWDQGHAPHPDERRIAFALEELSFRPLQLNPKFFAYGSFPIYVQRAWVGVATTLQPRWNGFHERIVLGRALSALVGIAMVVVLWRLGRRLYDDRTAAVAALFLALSVLPIQHAHFITVDLWQAALALAVLERLVAFVQNGRRRALFAGAALTGLALATKVSSVPLLLPLGAAAFMGSLRNGTFLVRAGLAGAALVISAAFFALGEPYALIDRTAFLHDVREQSEMVRHAGTVPYTIQYVGSIPYLDDLRQAVTWGMGPALGAAALFGTGAAFARAFGRGLAGERILLLFFVPYFAITGLFPVKFMRYLLPLYPLWCLYAARVLAAESSAPNRWRRAVAGLVVVLTALYAFAFVGIYREPHVWVTASRWFYREFPPGSKIATPHWEEGFPLGVDGRGPGEYRILELPLYEADNDAKMRLLAARLAEADTVVFPSKRLYGAISNAPERFPKTTRLFELLFGGELGYRLERVFSSRPRLFGFELDDDQADESFSVYDHPKTLVFRKQESLTADEVLDRLRTRVPSHPITRTAMLEAEADVPPSAERLGSRGVSSSLEALARWTIALVIFWLVGTRLLGTLLPSVPESAIGGLGPVFGYLLFFYLSWLPPALGFFAFDRMLCAIVMLVLGVLAWRARPVRGAKTGAFVLLVAFAFFVAIRAWNPEIFWGEKPMDFSFLNSLDRTTSLPPPEPWMSARAVNYPYLGHFAVAALGKLLDVPPAFSFNLGIASVAAFTASAAFGVGRLMTGRAAGGFVAALLVAAAGNLAGIVEVALRRSVNFDTFWATSRVIANTINEFPLWSFLFADLHAHVMVLPLSVLVIGLAAAWLLTDGNRGIALATALSLTVGAIGATSTWSLPIYLSALFGLGLLAAVRERRATRLVLPVLVAAASYVWFLPYWRVYVPPPRNWGWETEAAPLSGVLLIFGLPLFVAILALLDALRRKGVALVWRLGVLALIAAVAFTSTRNVLGLLALGFLCGAFLEDRPAARLAFALSAGATWIGALTDVFWLWDRMNTIFKAYLEMWLFLAFAAAYWLTAPGPRFGFVRRSALAILFLASFATAAIDVIATLRTERMPGPRPSLDGMAYLERHRPFEALAFRWLNENVAGSPVILEAQGPSYQDFGRVSMNTGLPTVLGWDYHLIQRSHSADEIADRRAAVEAIYTSPDRDGVAALLAHYRVGLVYVGSLERAKYGVGLERFASWRDSFQVVYRNPEVEIFAVPSNFHWTRSAPTIEQPVTAAARPGPEPPAAPGRLRQPRGLAVDGQGVVWVADFGNRRLQAFDVDLKPLRTIGRSGDGPLEFNDPCGVAVGKDGLIYVADTWNQRVQVINGEGKLVRQISGDFYGPRGIAISPKGTIYVSDTGNGRIAMFSEAGASLGRFAQKGHGPGELEEPNGIAIAADGTVYVADVGNRRIAVFDAKGVFRENWPVDGWRPGDFREPTLALLDDGRLVVADPPGDRLLIYDTKGRLLGEHALEKDSNPTGVAVGPSGMLYVAELKSDRIVKIPVQQLPHK